MRPRLPVIAQNAHLWLPGYLRSRWQRRKLPPPKHVYLMIADHFEPFWNGADEDTARRRVEMWRREWPRIADRTRDSKGRPPQYTFFYPEEEYRPHLLDMLAELKELKIADMEIHIHHDGEGEHDFVDRIERFKEVLYYRHGLLRKENGRIVFGFIHGNWALDNSRPDGRWCGLNNEITLLRDLGCFADFTLPSAPSAAQTALVNTIYWATDDPQRPKSHATGVPVVRGGHSHGDLLMIPGPLGVNWRERSRRLLPRLETGELASYALPTPERVRLWLDCAPRVGENLFVKLFSHGAQERNCECLLNGHLNRLFDAVTTECSRRDLQLFYVSAWDMFQIVAGNACLRSTEDRLRLTLVEGTA